MSVSQFGTQRARSRKHRRSNALQAAALASLVIGTAPIVFPSYNRAAATNATWTGPTSGNWSLNTNWSNAVTPNNTTFDVLTDNGNAQNSAVTLDVNEAINSLTISTGDSLFIGDNVQLQLVGGVLANAGTVSLTAGANNSILRADSNALMLSGGGTIILNQAGAGGAYLYGTVAMTNVNNVIRGSGNIGNNSTAFTNQGMVVADVSGKLLNIDVLNAGNTLTNTGTMTASLGGNLQFNGFGGGGMNNTGGTISAQAGSQVTFISNFTMTGGTLTTLGTGSINVPSGNSASFDSFNNTGNFVVSSGATAAMSGSIINGGSINLSAVAGNAAWSNSGVATLSGGGIINLSQTGAGGTAFIGGSGSLVSNNTIRGGGIVGNNSISITNTGTMLANNAAQTLVLDPLNAGNTFFNNGTLISDGGVLTLTGFGGGGFDNTNGRLIAAATDVQLISNAIITGGTFSSIGAGVIRISASNAASISNLLLAGNLTIDPGAIANTSGTIINNGSINITAGVNGANLSSTGAATLSGSGVVTLSTTGAGGALITGSSTLNTSVIIRGAGNVGGNGLAITNTGTILANVPAQSLAIDPANVGNSFINNGTLTANGGILSLTGNGGGGFDNAGGRIIAGSTDVQLITNVSVTGGTFASSGTGVIRVPGGNAATISNVTVTGNFTVDEAATANWNGTISNSGSINVNSGTNSAALSSTGNATLTGGGFINLSGTGAGGIAVINGSGTLNNSTVIRGSGNVGNNALTIRNTGTILANNGTLGLTIDPANAGFSFLNNATVTANGGILALSGNGGGAFDNTSGRIVAGSTDVQLTTNANITGGTLLSSGAGVIRVPASNTANLSNLTLSGNLTVDDAGLANWSGTFNNSGSINLNAATNNSIIGNGGTVVLSGGGVVNMTQAGAGAAMIAGSGTLTTNNLIRGAGNVGANALVITNTGSILASNATQTLTVDPANAGNSFINNGTLIANGGVLNLTGNGGGAFDNTGGRIIAGTTDLQLITNATVSGGTLSSSGAGVIRVPTGQTANISNLTLNGNFTVGESANANWSGTITNNGSINVTGSSGNSAMTLGGGVGTLSGAGFVNMDTTGAGSAFVHGSGTMVSSNTIRGRGLIGNNGMSMTNNGTVDASISGSTLQLDPPNGGVMLNQGTWRASAGNLQLTGTGGGVFNSTGGPINVLPAGTLSTITNSTLAAGTVQLDGTWNHDNSSTATVTYLRGAGTFNGANSAILTVGQNGSPASTSRIANYTLANGASVDLYDNDLIVTNGVRATITGQIVSARHGGAWDQSGLTSTAAKLMTPKITTLGLESGTEYRSIYGAGAVFDDFSVADSDLLIKYTYYGDANFNGKIDGADYSRIDSTFNQEHSAGNIGGWINGDWNYDGKVDGADYGLIDAAFNSQLGTLRPALSLIDGGGTNFDPDTDPGVALVSQHLGQFGSAYADAFVSAVPEPTAVSAIVAAGALGMLKRRRRIHL